MGWVSCATLRPQKEPARPQTLELDVGRSGAAEPPSYPGGSLHLQLLRLAASPRSPGLCVVVWCGARCVRAAQSAPPTYPLRPAGPSIWCSGGSCGLVSGCRWCRAAPEPGVPKRPPAGVAQRRSAARPWGARARCRRRLRQLRLFWSDMCCILYIICPWNCLLCVTVFCFPSLPLGYLVGVPASVLLLCATHRGSESLRRAAPASPTGVAGPSLLMGGF